MLSLSMCIYYCATQVDLTAAASSAAAAAVVSAGAPGGLGAFANPGINDILARRKYLEANQSSSESEDSDWDD